MSQALQRRRILIFAPVYWPGFRSGGPVRTIRNLVTALAREFDFHVVTADRDRGQSQPYDEVAIDRWNDIDGARVFYASQTTMRPAALSRLVAAVDPHVIYVNSLFDPVFSVRPLALRRLGLLAPQARWVLAPRGECATSALAIKRWKKRPYLRVSRLLGLHRGLTWQATNEREAADIRNATGCDLACVTVAGNLTEPVAPLPAAVPRSPDGPLRVCFLSRIAPMKNLAFAIDVLQRVRCRVRFDIYGPVADADYWHECERRLARPAPHLDVTVHGDVPHPKVRETLARHDMLFLPTLGENFGHVIFESLAAGVPVLISDRTPWRDLKERGAGWARPLDSPDDFVRIIEAVAASSTQDHATMRVAAHRYATSYAESPDVLRHNIALFAPDSASGLDDRGRTRDAPHRIAGVDHE